MLTITVGGTDVYDESSETFRAEGGVELQLEHSLVSLSKWESEFEKPFLSNIEKTGDEVFGYVRCMILTPNPPGDIFLKLSKENLESINAYVDRKMTATWFSDNQRGSPATREVITAELIYYWMTVFQIPFECETWHLNRLFTLIRICNIKQSKPKKASRTEIAARNRELNAQRRQQMGTTG